MLIWWPFPIGIVMPGPLICEWSIGGIAPVDGCAGIGMFIDPDGPGDGCAGIGMLIAPDAPVEGCSGIGMFIGIACA